MAAEIVHMIIKWFLNRAVAGCWKNEKKRKLLRAENSSK
jgi:hypothetical protein